MNRNLLDDMPPPPFVIASALYNLIYYGALITLLHFIARSALHSQTWVVQLLGIVPITVFLYHWLIPLEGMVQFLGVPMLGQLRWPNRQWTTMIRIFTTLFVARAVILIALFTEAFAAWTAFWHERGLIKAGPPLGDDTLAKAEQFYLWNLADAVPSLNVPESLQWHLGPTYMDWRSGALLLVFKIVVILPLVYGFVGLLRQIWDQFGKSQQATEVDETHEPSPG